MIEILNICLHPNSIFIKFLKILKIHVIFCENPRIIFVLFYDVRKENLFTIHLDGREAPSKASLLIKLHLAVELINQSRCISWVTVHFSFIMLKN